MMETNKSTDEIEINLGEIFALLLHKVWIIILAAVVCGAVGFLYSYFLITPQYQSTTKVYSFQQLFLRIMNSLLQAVML